MRLERLRDRLSETVTFDRQRIARRNPIVIRGPHHKCIRLTHLGLQQTFGVAFALATQAVAAHQLRGAFGTVRGGHFDRTHFVEMHPHTLVRGGEGGLRTGQSSANHGDLRNVGSARVVHSASLPEPGMSSEITCAATRPAFARRF